jgi:hypothetical protein
MAAIEIHETWDDCGRDPTASSHSLDDQAHAVWAADWQKPLDRAMVRRRNIFEHPLRGCFLSHTAGAASEVF